MKQDDILNTLCELLTPLVTGARGAVLVCADKMQSYELLREAPGDAYRVTLTLDGDEPAANGPEVQAGPAVRVKLIVGVVRAMGLPNEKTKAIHKPTAGGGVSMLGRADEVRKLLAGARWMAEPGVERADVDPGGLRYGGSRVLHLEFEDGAYRPMVEQTWTLWMALDGPEVGQCYNLFVQADPYSLADVRLTGKVLPAGWYSDTEQETLKFNQVTTGALVEMEAPTDGSRRVWRVWNAGTEALTLTPQGMTGGLVVAAGAVDVLIHWDTAVGAWAEGI